MYNKAILIGRMVADPEMKTTQNGVSVTSFRIAVDRAFAKERTADFFSITCWRQQAEFVCRYFSKGKPIGIEGAIQNREYTDKDGNKRTAPEVVVDRVYFGESKRKSDLDERPPFPDEKDAPPPVDMEQTKRDLDELSQFSNVRFADADGALPWE